MPGKAQTIVSGVAVNLIASGVTPFLCHLLFHSSTNTASLPFHSRFAGLYFSQYGLTYFALLLPFLIHLFIKYSRPGMRLMACGENPSALEASGISAHAIKWISLGMAGAVASLGGVFLATSHASQFTRDMSAGRGFIALAAVIFGKWRPIPTFFACLFFGLADSLQIHLQSKSLFGYSFPVEFVQATPYLITLFILAGFVGKSIPPRAITED
jgi:simple sugar transport system permease protein